jgi:adenine/guanine/hypoxanthine permease
MCGFFYLMLFECKKTRRRFKNMERLKKFFKIEERGTTIRTELIGGLVTFLAMAYILAVNPSVLGGAGMPQGGVFIATAVAAAVATLMMGLFANYPIALAPGMGINALVAYTIVGVLGYTWEEAIAAALIAGIIFLIITFTSLRKTIINSVPPSLKKAIGAGIGFFIAFIGLQNAGIIQSDAFIATTPDGLPVMVDGWPILVTATSVQLGDFTDPAVLLALFGIVLAFSLFAVQHKISKFAFIISILTTAFVGVVLGLLGVENMPTFGGGYADLSSTQETFFGFTRGLTSVFSHADLWFVIFSLLYLDIFDTAGTLISVAEPAGLLDENGEMKDIDRALMADAVGTVAGSIMGTSTVTSYIESSAGIESGARTGLSSVVVAVLFLASIVLYPVFSIFITSYAVTAMALVLVGVLMASQLKGIEWDDKPILTSTFVTIIMMVLTYSIGNGIAFGFIVYVLMMLVQGRGREVNTIMYVLAVSFLVYFTLNAVL